MGLYGTTLAPVGAVILAEVYLAKRFGLTSDWAARTGRSFNLAVLLAWAVPLAAFYYLYFTDTVSFPSYMTLPVYIVTGVLYLVLARIINRAPVAMRS